MSASNLRFFNRVGVEVDEFTAVTSRSWITTERGGEGDCTWKMSPFASKTKESTLQVGNFTLIESEESLGLPAWVGQIDLDPAQQTWSYGKLDMTAYTAERLLKQADTPLVKITGTPGAIFKKILDVYNADAEMPIFEGEIWTGGASREEQIGTDCFSEASRIAVRSGCEWDITHEVVNGKLRLYGNWYETIGEKTQRLLFEGPNGNVESKDGIFNLVGPIINTITGYTDASTEGTRLVRRIQRTESRDIYGPRRRSFVFSGVTDETTLVASINAKLDEYAFPMKQLELKVFNRGGIFQVLRKGNILEASLQKEAFNPDGSTSPLGFDGSVKVFSMQREDAGDIVELGSRAL